MPPHSCGVFENKKNNIAECRPCLIAIYKSSPPPAPNKKKKGKNGATIWTKKFQLSNNTILKRRKQIQTFPKMFCERLDE